jgi:hypothetical protein
MNEEKRIGVFYNGETGETVERELTPDEIKVIAEQEAPISEE